MPIEPGQVYRSALPIPSEPGEHYRRIKVVDELIATPGVYGFNKVDVATLTETGREIRRRAIEVTQLHDTATTHDGKPRRNGYVLEANQ